MKSMRLLAIPALMLVGGLVLTGCGGKDTPASSPSPTGAMMTHDDMMSPTPTPAMSHDDMMSTSPTP